MILYGYYRSSAAYRCRIVLNLKGIDYKLEPVHLLSGEQRSDAFRSINPQSLVPVLDVDGQIFTQSMAILEWLDETYPEPAILPADTDQRAHVRAFAQSIACEIHPLQNTRVMAYLRDELGHDQDSVIRWNQRWIGGGLAAAEALLQRDGHKGGFCFGDEPSLADICLIPQLYNAKRYEVDLSGMPRIRAIQELCATVPAFADAHPAKQPDAV